MIYTHFTTVLYIISADDIEECGVENFDFNIERGDNMVTFFASCCITQP